MIDSLLGYSIHKCLHSLRKVACNIALLCARRCIGVTPNILRITTKSAAATSSQHTTATQQKQTSIQVPYQDMVPHSQCTRNFNNYSSRQVQCLMCSALSRPTRTEGTKEVPPALHAVIA